MLLLSFPKDAAKLRLFFRTSVPFGNIGSYEAFFCNIRLGIVGPVHVIGHASTLYGALYALLHIIVRSSL